MKIPRFLTVEFPENLETKKAKWSYWFFWHWYLYEQGKGNVIGRVFAPVQEIGILLILIKSYFPVELSWFSILIIIIAVAVSSWLIGAIYVRYDLDRSQNMVGIYRNQVMRDLHKNMKGKKEKL